jgi:hypothetical protein
MPVTWGYREGVLLLEYRGHPTLEERREAVRKALADPAFRDGDTPVAFDTRSSDFTMRDAEELGDRVEWAVSLTAFGFRPRYAVIVDPSQAGVVDAGRVIVAGRVEVRTFLSMDEALAWLQERPPDSRG